MPALSPKAQGRAVRIVIALLLLWANGHASLLADPIGKEYEVKAVYLFNFAQFVTWPATAFAAADEPFRIGILGENPFDSFLEATIKGEKVEGHPLVVTHCATLMEARKCQILFISQSEEKKMNAILEGLKGKDILTVGDSQDFARDGGVIGFRKEDNKVHFMVNLEAAKRGNLTISSKMLRLAELVHLEAAP